MIQYSKQTDERREAGPLECWCLHGAVGIAADWRGLAKKLAPAGISTRAVDLWRFLDYCPMSLTDFGKTLNAEANGEISRNRNRVLLGYSMGGRLALHTLLEQPHSWQAAIVVSAHPGLENEADRAARRSTDIEWATQAITGNWPEFLDAWNAQSILGPALMRAPQASSSLIMRRREIARSFVDWSLGNQEPLWDRLGEISMPVLWVAGENDPKFLKLAQRAVSLMPHAQLATAADCGHRVPWEAEPWFTDQVTRFLQ